MRKLKFLLIILLLATTTSASEKVVISQWLTSGPFNVKLPAFHDVPNTQGDKFSNSHFLSFEQIDIKSMTPEENQEIHWLGRQMAKWEKAFSDENGFVELKKNNEDIQIQYLAAYIKTDRYISTKLEIKSPYMLAAYFNGERIGNKGTVEKEEGKIGKIIKDLELNAGTHLLIIKTLRTIIESDTIPEWKITASLELDEPYFPGNIGLSLSPKNIKNINHVLDGLKISSVLLSSDARYYIVNYRQALSSVDRTESWQEIKTVSDDKLIHSFRHSGISRLTWLPKSNRLSYIGRRDGKSTLYLHDIEKNNIEVLIEDVDKLLGYRWSPDETYFIYHLDEEPPSADPVLQQVIGMRDRLPRYRNRSFLYKYDLKTKNSARMTFGNLSSSIHDISPDGKKVLISNSRDDYSYQNENTFSFQDLYLIDVNDFSIDTLFYNKRWSVTCSFSPDGSKIVAVGGPSAFDGIGQNIPEGQIPNNYDMQAFIIDLKDKSVVPITKDFDPSISSTHWSAFDNNIYFNVTEEDRRTLYSFDTRRSRFSKINTGVDVAGSVNFSSRAGKAAYIGNMVNAPSKVYLIDIKNHRRVILEDVESENYKNVLLPKVYDWDFVAESGVKIKGRVYLPIDFDENSKYPVIVYYYGGTTPVIRSFGGRYPFNLWAGNGYIVYVLQPSGTIGFGQEYSAAHVNNWGITVADEIIEGTQKFLKAHPYADTDKVGCIGASYGGFMTKLLITRTDIFAAAISHAGISSISSYWGEGYWGYGYSAIASAGSFPWNNKDLYVGQSPLFHADKINTPLLLLTGDSDTNVPPGESFQMFTALRILDKPVELVLIKGEDHHIVTYSKRLKWHHTIMAYWDKMLKEQPEYWKSLFPEKNY